ncbi:helix-turn-helix transcriptional regulator [Streptomyces roseoverticillatus]|uniref:helix-turn-helix transcriptional regulator n=1 Tax=Streptomyces roseoverticillatus TaxID=66429 RepID=UPI001F33234A|nr:helix-turn-helix transcriptional regulator [Streptomyces roseoverticillatus]MCF3102425.1 helix-turn-helix transcriptional regulator [Streptomyces roseoverticillatus]
MTGARAVDERLLHICRGATVEICALLAGSPSASSDTGSGIPRRTVVERTGLAALPDAGDPTLIRVADRIPAELVIADRAVALLPFTPRTAGTAALREGPEPAALVVHRGPLLSTLVNLFEDIWNEALPIRVCADAARRRAVDGLPAGPDALDLEVLSLLMGGLTDTSVAKQLGLGLRTVQRRVKRLMELAGVTTRLQLGWHAAAHGWTTVRRPQG